jgi:hypothetical protein
MTEREELAKARTTIARLQSELARLRLHGPSTIDPEVRLDAMIEDFVQGLSYKELSLVYGLSNSRVAQILLKAAIARAGLRPKDRWAQDWTWDHATFPEALRRRFCGEPEPQRPKDTFGDDLDAWSKAEDAWREALKAPPKRPSSRRHGVQGCPRHPASA